MYLRIFSNNIWFYLLWSPVTVIPLKKCRLPAVMVPVKSLGTQVGMEMSKGGGVRRVVTLAAVWCRLLLLVGARRHTMGGPFNYGTTGTYNKCR